MASINEMKRLKLNDRANEMGEYLGGKLRGLQAAHPSIGEVRGIGLFWAVELVRNRKTKAPFNVGADKVAGKALLVDKVAARMMGNGVFLQAWMSHFVFAPPLIVTKADIDHGVAVFDEALSLADAEVER